MLIKIHTAYRSIVAVCDTELIGRKLEDKDRGLQMDLTGQFFQGDKKTPEEAREIIIDMRKEDASFNFVGFESCNLAQELGLISKEGLLYISGVPIALVLL